ncbi:uncharacterized protein BO80DRAFT_488210, partial [Aspergillus ibericus CBS 121593]
GCQIDSRAHSETLISPVYGVRASPCTRTGRFLSDTRCGLDSSRRRKLPNSALRLESSGDTVPHDGWRRAWVGDPTGIPISVELTGLRAAYPKEVIYDPDSLSFTDQRPQDGYAVHPNAGTFCTVAESYRDQDFLRRAPPNHLIVDRQGTRADRAVQSCHAFQLSLGPWPRVFSQEASNTFLSQGEQVSKYNQSSINMAHMEAVKHGSIGIPCVHWKSGRHVRYRC